MNCKEIELLIIDKILGKLQDKESSVVNEHCAECAQCADLLKNHSQTIEHLKQSEDKEIPEALISRIADAVKEADEKQKNSSFEKWKEAIWPSVKISIPVLACCALIIVYLTGRTVKTPGVKQNLNVETQKTFTLTDAARQDIISIERFVLAAAQSLSHEDESYYMGAAESDSEKIRNTVYDNIKHLNLNVVILESEIKHLMVKRVQRFYKIRKLKKLKVAEELQSGELRAADGAKIPKTDRMLIEEENSDRMLLRSLCAESVINNGTVESASRDVIENKIVEFITEQELYH